MELTDIINKYSKVKLKCKIPKKDGVPIRNRYNLKIVIKTAKDKHPFYVPDVVAWHLMLHKGWQLREDQPYEKFMIEKWLYNYLRCDTDWSHFYNFTPGPNKFDLLYVEDYRIERTHPDVIEAFEYWKPKGFEVIDISDKEYWYIANPEYGWGDNRIEYEVLYTR